MTVEADLTSGGLAILWRERSREPVKARSRDGGQGMKLIDRIVRTRRGTLDIEWQDDGLDVRMTFDTTG